jgi:hypothetical protein
MLVTDYSGFNFVLNPYQKKTYIFNSYDGVFICEAPAFGERFKYKEVIREADQREVNFYIKKNTD